MKRPKKILIIGAGFSGSIIARELAEKGFKVTLIEKRNHIGGNAFDYVNEFGIRIHKYGPHLFHTNNAKVYKYLSKYTKWIPYKHKVKAQLKDGRYVTFPANNETKQIVGEKNIDRNQLPSTGSEDFADMLRHVKGAYCFISHSGKAPLHSPHFTLDTNILPIGASVLAKVVEDRLVKS